MDYTNMREPYDWWNDLKHEGLLLSQRQLQEHFPAEPEPLSEYLEQRLRRAVEKTLESPGEHVGSLADIVLEELAGLHGDGWLKGPQVASEWSRRSITNETVKPWRIWRGAGDSALPVFKAAPQAGGKHLVKRLAVGRGRRAVTRVIEWLRRVGLPFALVTNGTEWRLVHGGADYHAWCEWSIGSWFEAGAPAPQVDAFGALLSPERLSAQTEQRAPLHAAVVASRDSQGELSDVLGERVREAVELLISQSDEVLAAELAEARSDYQHIYTAGIRVIMRLVVILFAEARELLPRSSHVYAQSYGLEHLHHILSRRAMRRGGGLRHSRGAWARILALSRLIYFGSPHQSLPVVAYGGELFQSGDIDSDDPVRRALGLLESPENRLSDDVVLRILNLITKSAVRVRQGRSWKLVAAPVDFSDLSSEYIGILYEGLLDFELRRASTEPVIFLNVGAQPALPFSRLRAMEPRHIKQLVGSLKSDAASDDELEVEEPAAEDEEEEEAAEAVGTTEEDSEEQAELEDEAVADAELGEKATLRAEVYEWAGETVETANLVSKRPNSGGAVKMQKWEKDREKAVKDLVRAVVLPGEWYLVRWGGTRKGRGTFYTPPGLVEPTVRRTLQTKVYVDGPEESEPVAPESILELKVCDPAMGSGSFLIGALRYLTEGLAQSLAHHGRIATQYDGTAIRLADGHDAEGLTDELPKVRPEDDRFDELLKGRLKRHIVERCVYGVDIDPLAVELARLSLWVETMDRELPFGFLDHKLKVGNSLVGAWLDQFEEYPVLAWEREGGDKNHKNFVNHFYQKTGKKGAVSPSGEVWTNAIKAVRTERVKAAVASWLEDRESRYSFGFLQERQAAADLHAEARKDLAFLHELPVHETERRRQLYTETISRNPRLRALREAMDAWCSIWFWPGDSLDSCPMPRTFLSPDGETLQTVRELAERHRFFHWELEFPDVFNTDRRGFDVILGNPPWDTQKPVSKEYFSNIDPLYRTYGKQHALQRQTELFSENPAIEREWIRYNHDHKAMSNWTKMRAEPFGDPDSDVTEKFPIAGGKRGDRLHNQWRQLRADRHGYADPEHPYRVQGSGDVNTYKLFLEAAYHLLERKGRMGMIVPGALYSDYGSGPLRDLFVRDAAWQWLFGFENRNHIFDIHSSYKFCATIIEKGGTTRSVKTSFMNREIQAWREADRHTEEYARDQIEQLSPYSKSFLEVRSKRDLELLEKIYAKSVLLGDESDRGWGVEYTREFDMTNDSDKFRRRTWWEERGYVPDELGHWLKGPWRERSDSASILERQRGLVLSRDGSRILAVEDIEDVALPLYEGRMIGQFDFAEKGWVSGTGRSAVWRDIPWSEKQLEPQYLMARRTFFDELEKDERGLKPVRLTFMDVTSATNARASISAVIGSFPAGNSVPLLEVPTHCSTPLASVLNSFGFDYATRLRLSGQHLNWFVMKETPIAIFSKEMIQQIALQAWNLVWSPALSNALLEGRESVNSNADRVIGWKAFAATTHERKRIRAGLDALILKAYGLSTTDVRSVLEATDLQVGFDASQLDPKGFWRLEKDKPPELRHTVLTQVAFAELEQMGLEAFMNLNNGEGWMLPESLRLSDYGLGHDERAKEPQPVAEALGPRFLPGQLEISAEDSWKMVERYAELKQAIVPTASEPSPDDGSMLAAERPSGGGNDLYGQQDLF